MKRNLFTLLLSIALCYSANAQLNNFNVGDNAPDFTVTDIHGNSHTLSSYSGKWVIVDLYAYWCGPCATIAPILNSFYKKYGCNSYDIVVLSVEYEGTHQQTVDFEDANGGDPAYPTPSVSGLAGGGAAVHSTYGPAAFPTIFLVGPDGKIKNEDIWPVSDVSTFENAVTNAGGSSALVVNNCDALEIEELSFTSVNLYPNPSNGILTLQIESPNSDVVTIEVYDLVGSKVWEKREVYLSNGDNSITLSLEELNGGHYILRTLNSNGIINTLPVDIR